MKKVLNNAFLLFVLASCSHAPTCLSPQELVLENEQLKKDNETLKTLLDQSDQDLQACIKKVTEIEPYVEPAK